MYSKFRTPAHMSHLLDHFVNGDAFFGESKIHVAVNIKEQDDKFEIMFAAPGLKKEDFDIKVDKNMLTVSFENKEEKTETDERWIRREFKQTNFKRNFSLTEKIEAAGIQAVYENGILSIALPKKEKEEVKPIAISVQ